MVGKRKNTIETLRLHNSKTTYQPYIGNLFIYVMLNVVYGR